MRKHFLLATAFAGLSAAPAFAGALIFEPEPEPIVQAAPAPAPAPAPIVTWTGPYAGLQVGWGGLDFEGVFAEDPDTGDDEFFDFDGDGLVYGAQLGYDAEFGGGFVLGGELSYNRLEAEVGDTEIDHLARLLARGGYSLGRTLLYVKGGGFWADADDAEDFGWVAGGGVEHLITDNVSAGVEYLYHQKDDFDDTGVDVTAQTLAARVNFRF